MVKLCVLVGVLLTGFSAVALAHGGATGIVKERMDGMVVLRQSMKALAAVVRDEKDDVAIVRSAAQAIVIHSSDALTRLFPEGSLSKASEAKIEIWSDWREFKSLADELGRHAEELVLIDNLSANKQAVERLFGEIGQTCKSCHEKFRLKKH